MSSSLSHGYHRLPLLQIIYILPTLTSLQKRSQSKDRSGVHHVCAAPPPVCSCLLQFAWHSPPMVSPTRAELPAKANRGKTEQKVVPSI